MAGKKRNIMAGQSGAPTAAANSILAGIYKSAGELGFDKVYGMIRGIRGLLEGQYADLSSQIRSGLDLEVLKRTPSAFLGSGSFRLPDIHEDRAVYEKIFALLEKLDIEVFIYIGSSDSMDTVRKLSDYAVLFGHPQRFIGVPTAVENDLGLTDHMPGFGSAAKYLAATVKEIICDAESESDSLKTVIFLEVMGQKSGWLAGAAALAKGEDCEGPDLIYLPEAAFDPDRFTARVREILEKKDCMTVIAADGIRLSDGRSVCEMEEKKADGEDNGCRNTSGTAYALAARIGREIGCRTEVIRFSTLLRAASHLASRTDIDEAFRAGRDAVRAASEGANGRIIVIERISDDPYMARCGLCDVHRITNEEKNVPREWMNKDASYVTGEFTEYVSPLIQGEYQPVMVNGLPRHLGPLRAGGSRRKSR